MKSKTCYLLRENRCQLRNLMKSGVPTGLIVFNDSNICHYLSRDCHGWLLVSGDKFSSAIGVS